MQMQPVVSSEKPGMLTLHTRWLHEIEIYFRVETECKTAIFSVFEMTPRCYTNKTLNFANGMLKPIAWATFVPSLRRISACSTVLQ